MPSRQPTPTMYDTLGRPLVNKGINYGINQGIRYGYQNLVKPAWNQYFGSGAEAVTEGSTAAGAATAGGESSLSGLGGTSWGSYAPALSVAAPLIMAYLKYQAGSGRNEPLEKQAETFGSSRMLSDLAAGKKIDPNSTIENYGLRSKTLPPWMTGGDEAVVDPRGYTPYDLYSRMHDIGSGRPQTGGLGNSGFSDIQIDEMMGQDKGKIATLMGLSGLPDWSKHNWSQGFAPGTETPYSKLHPQVAMDEGWNKLDEAGQRPYVDRSFQTGEDSPQNLWEKEKQQAEVEKLLGYQLRRKE